MSPPNPADPLSTAKPPRRITPWLVWAAFLLPLVLLVVVVVENWRGEKAWQALVAELTARGENLSPASVIPPLVPEEQNFAAAPVFRPLFDDPAASGAFNSPVPADAPMGPEAKEALRAIKINRPNSGSLNTPRGQARNWQRGETADLGIWQKRYHADPSYPRAEAEQTPAQDVLLALSLFDAPIEQMRQAAANRPLNRFPLRYDRVAQIELPHMVPLLGVSQVLTLRATAKLTEGDVAGAHADLLLVFRLSEAMQDEPLLISWLLRVADLNLASPPLWEGLVQHQWTDEQLRAFETILSRQNLVANQQTALRGERNLLIIPLAQKGKLTPYLEAASGGDLGGARILLQLLPQGWYDQNRVSMVRQIQERIDALEPTTRRIDVRKAEAASLALQESREQGWLSPYTFLDRLSMDGGARTLEKCATTQGTLHLARVAIALERYRLRHGEYPPTLEDLGKESLFADGKLPLDVTTGTPPKYQRDQDGTFSLYYVGWNGRDDGGVIHWSQEFTTTKLDYTHGDLVWPKLKKPDAKDPQPAPEPAAP